MTPTPWCRAWACLPSLSGLALTQLCSVSQGGQHQQAAKSTGFCTDWPVGGSDRKQAGGRKGEAKLVLFLSASGNISSSSYFSCVSISHQAGRLPVQLLPGHSSPSCRPEAPPPPPVATTPEVIKPLLLLLIWASPSPFCPLP